jgi:hypothetical protein
MMATCFDIATSRNEHVDSSTLLEQNVMSHCLYCDIHGLLKAATENEEMNLTEITASVTEVLADPIVAFPAAIRSRHIAYMLGYLAQELLARIDGEVEKLDPRGLLTDPEHGVTLEDLDNFSNKIARRFSREKMARHSTFPIFDKPKRRVQQLVLQGGAQTYPIAAFPDELSRHQRSFSAAKACLE